MPLILPYTFLRCQGFLNTSNHEKQLVITRDFILGLKTCKTTKKSGMEHHVHVYMERKYYEYVSNKKNMLRMIFNTYLKDGWITWWWKMRKTWILATQSWREWSMKHEYGLNLEKLWFPSWFVAMAGHTKEREREKLYFSPWDYEKTSGNCGDKISRGLDPHFMGL